VSHGKYYHRLETPDANREAEVPFDASIELDPRCAAASAWKAGTLGQAWNSEFERAPPTSSNKSSIRLNGAASVDENDTGCHRIITDAGQIRYE